jgi:hypothetical protein
LFILTLRGNFSLQGALALQWFEKAFQERAPILYVLKITPAFRALHGDPRFDALVKRIGIPD